VGGIVLLVVIWGVQLLRMWSKCRAEAATLAEAGQMLSQFRAGDRARRQALLDRLGADLRVVEDRWAQLDRDQ
jgi:hypothetical protein